METRFSELTYKELIEMGNNQSYADIVHILVFLQESIRHYFSRMLMDTSEESPVKCDIIIETEDSQGLCDSLKPHLIGIYQNPTEGIIYLQFEGDWDNWYELDTYPIDFQIDIIRAIECEDTNNKIIELWKNRKVNC